jgi:hypothetical protein
MGGDIRGHERDGEKEKEKAGREEREGGRWRWRGGGRREREMTRNECRTKAKRATDGTGPKNGFIGEVI